MLSIAVGHTLASLNSILWHVAEVPSKLMTGRDRYSGDRLGGDDTHDYTLRSSGSVNERLVSAAISLRTVSTNSWDLQLRDVVSLGTPKELLSALRS